MDATLPTPIGTRRRRDAASRKAQNERGRTGKLPGLFDFEDSTIFAVGMSLMEQAQLDAPEFYADSAARFLVARLVGSSWQQTREKASTITDRRLVRVLEYTQHLVADDLTGEDLARGADIH